MSGKIELLPCPFCGGKVRSAIRRPAGHDVDFVISCNCGVEFSPICALEEDCERAWNRRAAPVVERQPVTADLPKIEIGHIVLVLEMVRGAPTMTTNQCQAMVGLLNGYLEKLKEPNQ